RKLPRRRDSLMSAYAMRDHEGRSWETGALTAIGDGGLDRFDAFAFLWVAIEDDRRHCGPARNGTGPRSCTERNGTQFPDVELQLARAGATECESDRSRSASVLVDEKPFQLIVGLNQ